MTHVGREAPGVESIALLASFLFMNDQEYTDAELQHAHEQQENQMTLEEMQRRRHYTQNDTAAEAAIRKAVEEMEKSGIGGPNSTRAINLLHMARELHADDVDAALAKGAPLVLMQTPPPFAERLAELYGAALAHAGAPMDGTDPMDLMEWAERARSALANDKTCNGGNAGQ